MKNSKLPAIVCTFLSFGAIQETYRIFTDEAPDTGLRIMAVSFSIVLIALSLIFWFKNPSENKQR